MIEIDDGQGHRLYLEREARERSAAAKTNDATLQQTHLQLADRYQQRARELQQRSDAFF
jgi:hypothetical protein